MKSDSSGDEHIGTRLHSVRQENNLTQDQLAIRAGTSREVIEEIENGKSFRQGVTMGLAKALDVNPAWLQFGEPYARKAWPAEAFKKPKYPEGSDFAAMLQLADELINYATGAQLAETARLLALNVAHYQLRFGELPLANFEKLMDTQIMDDETAQLVAVGMENLIGVLGLVTTQSEVANKTVQ